MKVDDTKEQVNFQHCNPEELERVIDTQTKIRTYLKDNKINKLHSILIVVDDHADDFNCVRHSKLIASWSSHTQKYRSLANIIRLNASSLNVFKFKKQAELDSFVEESSALVDKKALLEMFQEATKEPYSFLNINSKDLHRHFI